MCDHFSGSRYRSEAIFQGGKVGYAPPKFHCFCGIIWCQIMESLIVVLIRLLHLALGNICVHLHGKSAEISITPAGSVSHSGTREEGILLSNILVGVFCDRHLQLHSAMLGVSAGEYAVCIQQVGVFCKRQPQQISPNFNRYRVVHTGECDRLRWSVCCALRERFCAVREP